MADNKATPTRTPGFFARNSEAGFYGPDVSPAGKRSPESPKRSFGQLMLRIAGAGFAVLVVASVMAPTARAEASRSTANAPSTTLTQALKSMDAATASMHSVVDMKAAKLAEAGKDVCYVVQTVYFGGKHDREYRGDVNQMAQVQAFDCMGVAADVRNNKRASASKELDLALGIPVDLDFYPSHYSPELKVLTHDAAFEKARIDNLDIVEGSFRPM